MKLSKVDIENFRSIKSAEVNLDDYTCLVGPNGCGKSTILMGLNVFFRNSVPNVNLTALTKDDFHHGDTSNPIRITLTFEDLSNDAKEDFKEYFRNGKLIVSAIASWDEASKLAPVSQCGSRLVMEDFAIYFGRSTGGAPADELKEIYIKIREKYPDLPSASTKSKMSEALSAYEEAHLDKCVLKDSTQQFYGFTKGTDRLAKYIQWVYVPAVKDASTEQEENRKTALGQLLERNVRNKINFKTEIETLKHKLIEEYEGMVQKEKAALKGLSDSLSSRLKNWSHPSAVVDVNWNYDREKAVSVSEPSAKVTIGEFNFIGEIFRLGHGIQRSFLIALLEELCETDNPNAPRLLLGFEEPEIYQHPPQAKHMSALLEMMSNKNTQTIITTHSPYFVPGKGFQSVRMVRKDLKTFESKVTELSITQLEKSISDALGEVRKSPSSLVARIEQIMQPSLKELFFCPVVILVEGVEDIAYISTYLELMGMWSSFRMYGCHFVVAGGKTNLSRPLAIANAFNIPTYILFDGDINDKDINKEKRDNQCILNLCKVKADPLSKTTIWERNLVMWPTNIGDVIEASFGENNEWNKAKNKVITENKWEGVGGKNILVIASTLNELWDTGFKSDMLEKLCKHIIDFAKAS